MALRPVPAVMTHEHPSPRARCGGVAYEKMEDEYGSLASGGSYERCRCVGCDKIVYSALPD